MVNGIEGIQDSITSLENNNLRYRCSEIAPDIVTQGS